MNDLRRLTITLLIFISCSKLTAQITLTFDTTHEPIIYAAGQLNKALVMKGKSLTIAPLSQENPLSDIHVVLKDAVPEALVTYVNEQDMDTLQAEGYIRRWINDGKNLLILAADAVGAEYALLELAEVIQSKGDYRMLPDKTVNPSLTYRIVKFNLPWSPYRKSQATSVHLQTCRDLQFWERFLDMMAENRLNVLSLWNNHPFPYMIKSTNFPEATPFNDQEMEEWQAFWKSLFRMAKQRGIQTFIVNWNIVVSPEFAKAYRTQEYNDLSDQVIQYTRESVTQMINEYEDLSGIGVTLADWMGNFGEQEMTPQKREDWIEATFVAGMKAANRPIKFLHRSVLAGDPLAMRKVIDRADLAEPALVEIKFNWSHGHSTPTLAITHDYHSGELDERFWKPKPENYNIQWMIRNEDFFILRWGQPDFIRQHIATNKKDYVNGYFIGSEGYIPAIDYSHKVSPVKTWQYAFEKQWLFYKVWGRLLYEADAPDSIFATAFDVRYGQGIGDLLLEAYILASNMPLRLASFHRSTWDYTLYSEGFIEAEPSSPNGTFDRSSPFISIYEFIEHETLAPNMLSIPNYVSKVIQQEDLQEGMITPLALADSSEQDSRKALKIVEDLRSRVNAYSGALVSELDDIRVWSFLGLYFADKLRAGVALESFRKTGDINAKQEAILLLEECLKHWDKVIAFTKDRYLPTPHVSTQHYGEEYQKFSWELLRPQVVRDIQLAKEANKKQ
ncbi:hypothetical protein [Catalinimonas niigatensis]|uniref:hypothetical protein n=1 Tax=Catalinimonas niigatensis TaxID=1397264 RepID=UPI002665F1E9|nr:hypothetical protein [Catalinimonas niigatensis]WPP50544.1 hypothetical protein PZB72_28165 [Catalinimonas niigatensis]